MQRLEQKSIVLLVDELREYRQEAKKWLLQMGLSVETAASGFEALQRLSLAPVNLGIIHLNLPLMSGVDVVRQINRMEARMPVILYESPLPVELAVDALVAGAFHCMERPENPEDIEQEVHRALSLAPGFSGQVELMARLPSSHRIIGSSKAMQEVLRGIRTVQETNVTVLLEGESGTGKELVARAVHLTSPRKNGPFIPVNCAAIPETLLESELFGHEKGAFTGATARRIGRFEQANGGTLFLDEIGEMSLALQAKILRILEERNFERVGGEKTIHSDVRVISATNKILEKEIRKGRFREDLFYRLHVFPIYLPPLRDRKEDLYPLCLFLLNRLGKKNRRRVEHISPDAITKLEAYHWPGNVRQLENVLERALLYASGGKLCAEHLLLDITSGARFSQISNRGGISMTTSPDRQDMPSFGQAGAKDACKTVIPLKRLERQALVQALEISNYNISRASRMLGIGRATLYRKIQYHRIQIEDKDVT